jgi:hypothetical protein
MQQQSHQLLLLLLLVLPLPLLLLLLAHLLRLMLPAAAQQLLQQPLPVLPHAQPELQHPPQQQRQLLQAPLLYLALLLLALLQGQLQPAVVWCPAVADAPGWPLLT